MNMKHIIYTLFLVFVCSQMIAQPRYFDERYIFTQSYAQPVIVNPGAIAQSGYHSVLLGYRNTWGGFDGTPKSFLLSYNGDLGNRLGLGALVLSDTNGALETTKGLVGVSYTIESPDNKVGIGLTGEIIQHGVDSGVLNDELLDENDQSILARFDGINYFDVSFGVFGEYQEKFIYGLALPSLISSLLTDTEVTSEQTFGYIVQLGYKYDLPQYDMKVTPSIMAKQLNYVPFHVDINVLGEFLDEKLTGGLSYTVGADERLGFLIGARLNAFNFFYSYNISRHEFQSYNNGSHEVSVRFDIGRKDRMTIQKEEMMDKDL